MKRVTGYRLVLVVALFLLFPKVVLAEETVCLQCHAGQKGHLGEPVAQWQTSVHAANGISCHDCHGGDPTDFAMAMDPERGFIGAPAYVEVPDFCGRCHLGVKEDYLASAHGQALEAGGAQCVLCHGSHAIQLASIELINEQSCSRCHDYERATKVKQAIAATEETLVNLEVSVAALHRVGIDVERLENDLFAKRNDFRRVFHTVKLEKINAQTAEFDQALAETKTVIAAYETELDQRKLVGAVLVVLLLLGSGIAYLVRRSYLAEE